MPVTACGGQHSGPGTGSRFLLEAAGAAEAVCRPACGAPAAHPGLGFSAGWDAHETRVLRSGRLQSPDLASRILCEKMGDRNKSPSCTGHREGSPFLGWSCLVWALESSHGASASIRRLLLSSRVVSAFIRARRVIPAAQVAPCRLKKGRTRRWGCSGGGKFHSVVKAEPSVPVLGSPGVGTLRRSQCLPSGDCVHEGHTKQLCWASRHAPVTPAWATRPLAASAPSPQNGAWSVDTGVSCPSGGLP